MEPSTAKRPLILLAGPTATGKTALAVRLAQRLNGEIISADSMQVYRGCPIGSAQPSAEELQGVPCHLVAEIPPDRVWSVADWLRAARQAIRGLRARNRTAIVAGGTGLYFKALTEGLFESEGAGRSDERRAELEARWRADGGEALRAELERVDPPSWSRIHPNDCLRVVRAMEVYLSTGVPMSQLQERDRRRRSPLEAHRFVLSGDREAIYRRIDARVDRMVEQGFIDEVRALLDAGAGGDWPVLRGIGYGQLAAFLRGRLSLGEAVEETKRMSCRYAKQQIVLYRKWPGAVWLDIARGEEANAAIVEKSLEISPYGGF